jgi:predicted outer membrane repeat protein
LRTALRFAAQLAGLGCALLALGQPAGAGLVHAPGAAGSLQGALDLAQAGDLVLIAPGVYDEGSALLVRGGITLRGGGSRPEDTLLSGGYMHQILSLSGEGGPIRIENLTLADGFAVKGAGMSIAGAEVSLDGVRFLRNAAAGDGGAIYAEASGLHVTNCLFFANYASGGAGAAMHIQDAGPEGSMQLIEYCTFAANAGCCGGRSLVLVDCRVEILSSILEDVECLAGAEPVMRCNNGSVCGLDAGGNFIADPRFCNFEQADCRLEPDSPCLAANNPECGQIGAYGGCELTAVAPSSFGAIKSLYR